MSDYEIDTKLGIFKATFYREVEQLTSDLVAYTIYSTQKAQKEYEFNATAKGPQLKIEKELGTEQFKRMFKTTTVDNGSEFLDFQSLETSSECPHAQRTIVYYCHPYSSHERGTNEQLNGLIRRFIPKGCHIEELTEEYIQEIQDWFHHCPRRILNGGTPAMLMVEYMNSLATSTALMTSKMELVLYHTLIFN